MLSHKSIQCDYCKGTGEVKKWLRKQLCPVCENEQGVLYELADGTILTLKEFLDKK